GVLNRWPSVRVTPGARSTNLHNLPTRAYGNDGNDGRTPGGWRVQLAEGARQLDQESQTGGGISRRGARRGAGTLRVEPLVREDGGAKRRSPNRPRTRRRRTRRPPRPPCTRSSAPSFCRTRGGPGSRRATRRKRSLHTGRSRKNWTPQALLGKQKYGWAS